MAKPSLRGGGADLFVSTIGGRKCVRRVPTRAHFGRTVLSEAKFEADIHKLIGAQPFSTNLISSDKSSLTYEYIEGRELFYSADGAKVGKALAALHDFTSSNPLRNIKMISAHEFILSNLLHLRESGGELVGDALASLNSAKGNLPSANNPAPCLAHNHLSLRNIIIDSSNSAHFVDWSWAQYSDPVLDLLSFTCPATTSSEYELFISEKQQKEFLSAYFAARALDSRQIDAMREQFRLLCGGYCALILAYSRTQNGSTCISGRMRAVFADDAFAMRAIDEAAEISSRAK